MLDFECLEEEINNNIMYCDHWIEHDFVGLAILNIKLARNLLDKMRLKNERLRMYIH